MAVAGVAVDRAVAQVGAGLLEVAHAAVADVAEEIGLVEQFQDEAGIAVVQLAQHQARGADERCGRHQNTSTRAAASAAYTAMTAQ